MSHFVTRCKSHGWRRFECIRELECGGVKMSVHMMITPGIRKQSDHLSDDCVTQAVLYGLKMSAWLWQGLVKRATGF